LIITYYWPPSGGAGVQRWLKFAKYLSGHGWMPIIYTPSNPEYPVEDKSLINNIPEDNIVVIKNPIWEPYKLYKIFAGKKRSENIQAGFLDEAPSKSRLNKFFRWLRGNLFIPDARVFWIKPSVRFLAKLIEKNPVDLVVSTGPPHSMHLIALGLKKRKNIKWIADFRDPWTGIYYFKDLNLSGFARKRHKKLEKTCLNKADRIIAVGNTMKSDFEKLTSTPVEVITNGFDQADYDNVVHQKADRFTIMYTGSFLPDQNPPELWEALGDMVKENRLLQQQLELLFIGKTDSEVIKSIEKNGLKPYLKLKKYVPHANIPHLQQKAALMLLCINRIENASYIITGKVFEYLASGKPILAICPENSDVADIIRETSSGWVIPFDQKKIMINILKDIFQKHIENQLIINPKDIYLYSRKELSRKLSSLFNTII